MSLTQAEKERFVYGKVASLVSEIIIMKKGIIITMKRFTMDYNEKIYIIFRSKLIIKHISEI